MTKKFTELTNDASPALADIVATSKSPFGAGTSRKVTLANLQTLIGGGSVNPTDTRMPYNNAGTFADSYAYHDTGNSQTGFLAHVMLQQNTGKILGFGNTSIAFGGLMASGVGCMKVVADAAGNPGTLLSNFVAPPLPGGAPAPWSRRPVPP